ncbi:hypothetical protein NPX13_g2608 [Xylaria arbuscula]|uniref:Uncharacterized protein n=1 Tax=Xylaria arbuscula TaxID=114810 RepID=A0A9W8TNK9_9PEZI|nr:hypothetical protein NPX13_g2608 [Xylaria arbuscula]
MDTPYPAGMPASHGPRTGSRLDYDSTDADQSGNNQGTQSAAQIRPRRPSRYRQQSAESQTSETWRSKEYLRLPPPPPDHQWQPGDIAFLKKSDQFNKTERDAVPKLPDKATGHPVIVLDRSPDGERHTIITVSAYNSGEENNYLPPWKQVVHERKDKRCFRAFKGSERPDNYRPYLELIDGQQWPKPKMSWVYVRHWSTVPKSTLIWYDKPASQLRMDRESRLDLVAHIQKACSDFHLRWDKKFAMGQKTRESSKAMLMQQDWRQNKENDAPSTSNVALVQAITYEITPPAQDNAINHQPQGERASELSYAEVVRSEPPTENLALVQITTHERMSPTEDNVNYDQQQGCSASSSRCEQVLESITNNNGASQVRMTNTTSEHGNFNREQVEPDRNHRHPSAAASRVATQSTSQTGRQSYSAAVQNGTPSYNTAFRNERQSYNNNTARRNRAQSNNAALQTRRQSDSDALQNERESYEIALRNRAQSDNTVLQNGTQGDNYASRNRRQRQ